MLIFKSIKISDILVKNYQNQKQTEAYQIENSQLNEKVQNLNYQILNLRNQVNQLSVDNIEITEENLYLSNENSKLNTAIISLTNQQNAMIDTISQAFQSGFLKPSKIGFTPIFRFSTDPVDKEQQQKTLYDLSQGSYNFKQEIVTFSLDDMKEWKDVGTWTTTGYRAIVQECDSNPSITASGDLATPGYSMGVDLNYYPFGTIFYIENFGFFQVTDCGGGIKGGNRADLLTASDFAYQVTKNDCHVWLVYMPPQNK